MTPNVACETRISRKMASPCVTNNDGWTISRGQENSDHLLWLSRHCCGGRVCRGGRRRRVIAHSQLRNVVVPASWPYMCRAFRLPKSLEDGSTHEVD